MEMRVIVMIVDCELDTKGGCDKCGYATVTTHQWKIDSYGKEQWFKGLEMGIFFTIILSFLFLWVQTL